MKLNSGSIFLSLTLVTVSMGAQADDTNIEKLIKSNGLGNTKVMSMYQSGQLVVDVKTPNKVILVNKETQRADEDADKAMYWYRGMNMIEFVAFNTNDFKIIPCTSGDNLFCGITPQYKYAADYLSNANPGVVMEFGTIEPSWLYNEFTTKHKCQIKAEGGGTYGLGSTGTYASCDELYRKEKLGKVFNQWINPGKKIDVVISSVLLTVK
ncbi:TPA: hypothetical protein SIA26_001789 [Aeromonas bestiarum]|nr:hypothetical protein [Aeromonas bestiarum]